MAKTNREVHEEAAGMGLCPEFFQINGIDPDATAPSWEAQRAAAMESILRDIKELGRSTMALEPGRDAIMAAIEEVLQKWGK